MHPLTTRAAARPLVDSSSKTIPAAATGSECCARAPARASRKVAARRGATPSPSKSPSPQSRSLHTRDTGADQPDPAESPARHPIASPVRSSRRGRQAQRSSPSREPREVCAPTAMSVTAAAKGSSTRTVGEPHGSAGAASAPRALVAPSAGKHDSASGEPDSAAADGEQGAAGVSPPHSSHSGGAPHWQAVPASAADIWAPSSPLATLFRPASAPAASLAAGGPSQDEAMATAYWASSGNGTETPVSNGWACGLCKLV